jgi:hypothetical protein
LVFKHSVMQTYGGVEAQFHAFLNSTLGGDQRLAASHCLWPARKKKLIQAHRRPDGSQGRRVLKIAKVCIWNQITYLRSKNGCFNAAMRTFIRAVDGLWKYRAKHNSSYSLYSSHVVAEYGGRGGRTCFDDKNYSLVGGIVKPTLAVWNKGPASASVLNNPYSSLAGRTKDRSALVWWVQHPAVRRSYTEFIPPSFC